MVDHRAQQLDALQRRVEPGLCVEARIDGAKLIQRETDLVEFDRDGGLK
jgi:hypothetical protein